MVAYAVPHITRNITRRLNKRHHSVTPTIYATYNVPVSTFMIVKNIDTVKSVTMTVVEGGWNQNDTVSVLTLMIAQSPSVHLSAHCAQWSDSDQSRSTAMGMLWTSAGRFGRAENDSIRFADNFDSIQFDSIRWNCLFVRLCLNPFAAPYGFVNNGYANSVCCIYFRCTY